jgi:hypothetical protein
VVNDDYMGHNFVNVDFNAAVAAPKHPDLHLLPMVAQKLLDGGERGGYKAGDRD